MQDLNYWKQFESTGKIEDYLSYCCCDSGKEEQHTPVADATGQLGENSYAGIHMCNRNDIEADAYRRI